PARGSRWTRSTLRDSQPGSARTAAPATAITSPGTTPRTSSIPTGTTSRRSIGTSDAPATVSATGDPTLFLGATNDVVSVTRRLKRIAGIVRVDFSAAVAET